MYLMLVPFAVLVSGFMVLTVIYNPLLTVAIGAAAYLLIKD